MPKDRRTRISLHNSSVKLAKRQLAAPDNQVEHVEIGSALDVPAQELLQSTDNPEAGVSIRKKDKLQLKKEAFLQRLELTGSPYSKSHQRRLKRKAREQLGQGLNDIRAVLHTVDKAEESQAADNAKDTDSSQNLLLSKPRIKPGQIGEGKSSTLSTSQRKQILQVERLRMPLIMSNPQFSSNPFQTIRTHAQNTLVKHESS
ncbi:hypothetical protein K435DRAFT_961558 [Dendrothele bispora CBS 962.96]|uniref:Ribosome biogenesis protein SLX9 n=1 Tax=Dendrothele bispora (strain CBS 962.96) TaxID=1314807 RepID=A0A4S8LQU0_DENBC|nr:hypothetical protein K435DRAFT_726792 [Dendrothele bispora CBS 962.96]THV04822.1 hypothetical protein K435DRAFT_961558 [Dendrothele bispora CBS 962.96]